MTGDILHLQEEGFELKICFEFDCIYPDVKIAAVYFNANTNTWKVGFVSKKCFLLTASN